MIAYENLTSIYIIKQKNNYYKISMTKWKMIKDVEGKTHNTN